MFGWAGKPDFEAAMLKALDRRDRSAVLRIVRSKGPDFRDRDGRTLLANAVSRADLDMSRLALELGCDPSAADTKGLTPLHFAVIGVQRALVEALLAAGAAVDCRDSWGNTPLNRAIPLADHEDAAPIVVALIRAGADPEAANNYGVTPSSWAAETPALREILELSA